MEKLDISYSYNQNLSIKHLPINEKILPCIYIVKKTDTLTSIAKLYKVNLNELREYKTKMIVNKIKPGQILNINLK